MTLPRFEPEEDGFTLVELLIVVIIIGILAAIAIPIYLTQREKAADATAKSDVRNAALAEETYFADHRSYADIATVNAEQSVKVSKGTSVISVFVGNESYCLGSINSGGSPLPASQSTLAGISTTVVWWYDSAGGGLQPRNATLSPTNYGCPRTNPGAGASFSYATVSG